ncbi:MAG: oligosaccharide flippase family protein, partial [Methylobacter sp.]
MNNKSEQKNSGTKQLFSDAAIYAFANILQRGMMLILLPIYARYFTKSEFGAVDLLYQSILILILISSIGLPQGLPRGFYKENVTEEDNKKLLGVLVIFILPITLLFFFLVWIFS